MGLKVSPTKGSGRISLYGVWFERGEPGGSNRIRPTQQQQAATRSVSCAFGR